MSKEEINQSQEDLQSEVDEFRSLFAKLEEEVSKVIVGNKEVVRGALSAVFAGGHVLLEGVPGLGKTLLVKSLANALGLSFKRIQFTPDLMPSDVTGTQVLNEDDDGKRRFVFKPGPVFTQVLLADEINRATPKTQAALLEAMEEKQVTVLNETHKLPQPFFVLATQNPVEFEGTYPLPEAQLDRFMMKLLIESPSSHELKEVLVRTTGVLVPQAEKVFEAAACEANVRKSRLLVRRVHVAPPLLDALARVIAALTPSNQYATAKVKRYVRFGPGPRGAQSVVMLAKVRALAQGRLNISFDDVRAVLTESLRHRLVCNFQAETDGVTAEDILKEVRQAK